MESSLHLGIPFVAFKPNYSFPCLQLELKTAHLRKGVASLEHNFTLVVFELEPPQEVVRFSEPNYYCCDFQWVSVDHPELLLVLGRDA